MHMQSLIDDLVEPDMTVPDYPVTIKTDDGGDTPPNTGDVRMRGNEYDLFLKGKRCLKIIKQIIFYYLGPMHAIDEG